jgi:hypothetical protein
MNSRTETAPTRRSDVMSNRSGVAAPEDEDAVALREAMAGATVGEGPPEGLPPVVAAGAEVAAVVVEAAAEVVVVAGAAVVVAATVVVWAAEATGVDLLPEVQPAVNPSARTAAAVRDKAVFKTSPV